MQTFDSIVTGASVRRPTSSPIQTWSPIVSRHGNEMFTFARITTPRPIVAPNTRSSAQRRGDGHGNAFSNAAVVCLDNLSGGGSELNLPRLQKAGVEFHRGDVRDGNSFPAGPFDYLIECSAEPSVLAGQDGRPDYLFQTNLVGAYN